MTEQEWLDSSDPARMLHVVTGKAEGPHAGGVITPRKLRLWGCACCRAMPPTRDAEIIANEKAFIAHVEAMADVGTNATRPPGRMRMAVSFLQYSGLDVATYWARDRWGEEYAPVSAAARAYLLREIVGNPFRVMPLCGDLGGYPVQHKDGIVGCQWCDAIRANPTVKAVAEGIYAQRDWSSLPILADALEDAGCGDHWGKGPHQILAHLRSRHPNVLGCWALDLILGRE